MDCVNACPHKICGGYTQHMKVGDTISESIISQLLKTPEWMDDSACLDIDPFDENAMEGVCESCPVFDKCSTVRDILIEGKNHSRVTIAGEFL